MAFSTTRLADPKGRGDRPIGSSPGTRLRLQQLRQLRHVGRDPPRLVAGVQLGGNVCLTPKAVIDQSGRDVRFVPKSRHVFIG